MVRTIESIRGYMPKILLMWLTSLVIGGLFIVFCQFLPMDEQFMVLDSATIPKSALRIFMHNAKFSFLYAVPYIGIVYYSVSFIFVYAIIGAYVHAYGYGAAIGKLVHVPLEMLALTIPLFISFRYKTMSWQAISCLIGLSIMLLFVSSFIEFFMSRGVSF